MAHWVLTFVYFCCKKLTHIMTSTYNKINYAYHTYVIGKITYVSYMWSHLDFVYNLLVTDLSVQIYTTYCHFLKIQKQQDALPLVRSQKPSRSLPLLPLHILFHVVGHHVIWCWLCAIPRCRTVNCGWRYNLELPCQCTANITYNLAAVVDIWPTNHRLQIGIGG